MSFDPLRFAMLGLVGWLWCCATGHKPEHAGTRVCLCGSSLWKGRR